MSSAPPRVELWLPDRQPSPLARWRLFCFGPVGAGASAFRGWAAPRTPPFPEVEVCAVELPGRESRAHEKPFQNLASLVGAVADGLAPALDVPFALLGHAMGARIACALARELQQRGGQKPRQLFVSRSRPPHLPARDFALHEVGKAELLEYLRATGEMPADVVDHPELTALLLPTLGADLAIEATLSDAEPTLEVGLVAIRGELDKAVKDEQLDGWRQHTRGDFSAQVIAGADRSYLYSRAGDLQEIVRQRLRELGP